MTQQKTLLLEALFFALGIFASFLLLDWITGNELDYTKRAIIALIATPIYLAIKHYWARWFGEKTDA